MSENQLHLYTGALFAKLARDLTYRLAGHWQAATVVIEASHSTVFIVFDSNNNLYSP